MLAELLLLRRVKLLVGGWHLLVWLRVKGPILSGDVSVTLIHVLHQRLLIVWLGVGRHPKRIEPEMNLTGVSLQEAGMQREVVVRCLTQGNLR